MIEKNSTVTVLEIESPRHCISRNYRGLGADRIGLLRVLPDCRRLPCRKDSSHLKRGIPNARARQRLSLSTLAQFTVR